MENKEIKKVPDISFSDKKSAKKENAATKTSVSAAVKSRHEKTTDKVSEINKTETPENKLDPVNEAAQERISEHKASLDQLFMRWTRKRIRRKDPKT